MVEALDRRLEHERRTRSIHNLRIARGVKIINHSQFFDDILLTGGASKTIASHFKMVLDQYTLVSGGLFNKPKATYMLGI
jgi:hypothetical protein